MYLNTKTKPNLTVLESFLPTFVNVQKGAKTSSTSLGNIGGSVNSVWHQTSTAQNKRFQFRITQTLSFFLMHETKIKAQFRCEEKKGRFFSCPEQYRDASTPVVKVSPPV